MPVGRATGVVAWYEGALPEKVRVNYFMNCYVGDDCGSRGCRPYVRFSSNRPRVDWENVVVFWIWIAVDTALFVVLPIGFWIAGLWARKGGCSGGGVVERFDEY